MEEGGGTKISVIVYKETGVGSSKWEGGIQ